MKKLITGISIGIAFLTGATGMVQAFSLFCGSHLSSSSVYHINPNFADAPAGTAQQQIDALVRAADEWTNNGESQFQWIYGGQSSNTSIATQDGHNVIYSDPGNGGSTLAETFCSSSGSNIVGWDMRFFDGDHTFAINPGTSQFDIEGIAVHELGHALGLGHSSSGAASMFSTVISGQSSTQIRSIENDDKAGIQFLYGTNLVPPTIVDVQPFQGFVRGGQTVTLTGTSFTNNMTVRFGGVIGTVASVTGTTMATVTTPKGSSVQAVDVQVQHPGGSGTLAGGFAYITNPNEVSFTGSARINKTIDVIVYGPPNADYAVIATPTVGPSIIKGYGFCFRRDSNIVVIGKSFGGKPPVTPALDSTGEVTLGFKIPNDVSLIFNNLYLQGIVDLDPSPVDNFVVTNCVTITVFP